MPCEKLMAGFMGSPSSVTPSAKVMGPMNGPAGDVGVGITGTGVVAGGVDVGAAGVSVAGAGGIVGVGMTGIGETTGAVGMEAVGARNVGAEVNRTTPVAIGTNGVAPPDAEGPAGEFDIATHPSRQDTPPNRSVARIRMPSPHLAKRCLRARKSITTTPPALRTKPQMARSNRLQRGSKPVGG